MSVNLYNPSSIVDYVEIFWKDFLEKSSGMNIDDYFLHINSNHKSWYFANYMEKYGHEADTSRIKWQSHMSMEDCRMWISE